MATKTVSVAIPCPDAGGLKTSGEKKTKQFIKEETPCSTIQAEEKRTINDAPQAGGGGARASTGVSGRMANAGAKADKVQVMVRRWMQSRIFASAPGVGIGFPMKAGLHACSFNAHNAARSWAGHNDD